MGGRKEEPRQGSFSSTVTPSQEYLSLSSQIGHHTRDIPHVCSGSSWQLYVNETPKDCFVAHDKYANTTPATQQIREYRPARTPATPHDTRNERHELRL
jgi:hypothetical protein